MFIFLLSNCQSITYNLYPPFKNTAPGEFGLWSVAGSTSNAKNHIHITSRKNKINGALCSRIPTSYQNFETVLNVSLISGSFHYLFTQDACPIVHRYNGGYWRGFSLNFNESNEKLNISFTIVRNDYTYNTQDLCLINTTNPVIKVKSGENEATVQYFDGNKWKDCGSKHVFPYLVVGYFTLTAFPIEEFAQARIYSFNTSIPYNYSEEFDTTRLEKLVKRIVNPKTKKEKPMSLATRISYSLPEDTNSSEYFKYIDIILAEMNVSLTNALNSTGLKSIIDKMIKTKLSRIEKKFSKRKQLLQEIDDSMKRVKAGIQVDLNQLESNIYSSMETAKHTSVSELKKFLDKVKDAESLTNSTKESAKEMKSMWLPTFLYVISFIELALYIAFFFQRKKATHNFKKYD
ncbi:hypothetical protein TVAG_099460 [Trichomonas vaginalis G3]|uniref:Uncharacterized protein n=1 Tax=Trichomonas vaginalis (strain ATCC PRA-98 / G3) TaxID=412133 RepID=A2FXV6_TRIV3|nr:lectin leg-like domain-containing protein [Trichomonas vaginalis G3]EAX90260.1 hypothetical protein TVAG_099460 [Trichomonas vaginalis G3]KAI5499862.1 lectin leg-like domain-containing protein [Trichomonas vaginalis G3]|eukprot:XP_001303190.1 hypothetical protein [Trichomonas vaginalis G3]